jgi:hypothetical protein
MPMVGFEPALRFIAATIFATRWEASAGGWDEEGSCQTFKGEGE